MMTYMTDKSIKTNQIPPELFFRDISNITVKVHSGCNLACKYCGVDARGANADHMDVKTFKRIADLIIWSSLVPYANLEFHGGEPLLLPESWFEDVVQYATGLAAVWDKKVEFTIVTNGTLLNESRIDMIKKLNLHVCISVDGPPDIHNVMRGKGEEALNGLKLLQRNHIPFGLITVLSKGNCNKMDAVMKFYEENNITRQARVSFLHPLGRGRSSEILTSMDMFTAFRDICDHMVESNFNVIEATIESIINRYFNHKADHRLSCWGKTCGAGQWRIVIDHNGNIYPCEKTEEDDLLGNIFSKMDVNRINKLLSRYQLDGDPWFDHCEDCEAERICFHSCAAADLNDPRYRTNECRFFKLIYRHIKENEPEFAGINKKLNHKRQGAMA